MIIHASLTDAASEGNRTRRSGEQVAFLSNRFWSVWFLMITWLACSTASADHQKKKPTIFFYHDGRHPLIYMYEPPMTKEEYESVVDELVGTPVEAIMFGLGDGRTVLHDTQVGEVWGHHVKQWDGTIYRRARQNATGLIDQGHDPLRVLCERAREKGILIYPTLFMNQSSGELGKSVRSSLFRMQNKHLEIGADGDLPQDFPGLHNADFSHKEVRDERIALIQETLQRYEVDGFELHFYYSPYFFHPDRVEAGREILTRWVEDVYRLVKDSGPHRELAVRIPVSLKACEAVGMDVREWIRRGIVDVVTAVSMFGPAIMEQSLDLAPLVEAAQGSRTRIVASLYGEVHSDRLMDVTIEMARAGASNYWAQGVDGLLLDQWFGHWPYRGSFYETLRELPHPDVMAPRDKTYFLLTEAEEMSPARIRVGLDRQLPRNLNVNEPVQAQWRVSDDLARWDKAGRVHQVLLRVRLTGGIETDQVRFEFNGKPLSDTSLRKINQVYKMRAPRHRVFGYWYLFQLDKDHWPIRGVNELKVTLLQRDSDLTTPIRLRDVELDIKYLLGKNFHRADDNELGTSEARNY